MAWRFSKPAASSSASASLPGSVDSSTAGAAGSRFVQRDFYLEHPDVSALTPEEVQQLRQQLGITVHGEESLCPNPVSSFVQASFPQYILDALRKVGFSAPTPIQRQGWPVAMKGIDLVGLAETGSGKTLAYLLPAIVHVNAQPVLVDGEGPLALVLAPTRELAEQIHEEVVRFGQPCGVKSCCVYGGVSKADQVQVLRKAPEVVVATPGRLVDMLQHKKTELGKCTFFVLDEADRMLDMGFEQQLAAILAHMRADRQTLMFSATWPAEVQALASKVRAGGATSGGGGGAPPTVIVEVGGALLEGGKANESITQRVLRCEEAQKLPRLIELLEETMDGSRILVFASSKRRCDMLTKELRVDGWPALTLHGDKSQEERDWVLQQFKDGEQPLLIATDVAQRGLDIKGVVCVINYDCPNTGEGYVHRIGRTGRAGNSGTAYTFVAAEDRRVAPDLVRVLKGSGQTVPAELAQLAQEARAEAKYRPGARYQ